MKVRLAILCMLALFVAVSTGGAGKGMVPSVQQIVVRAVANEIEAAVKYEAAAAKAIEDGYPGAASLFRAAAAGERTHAARFEKLLKSRGVDFTAPAGANPSVWSTAENLRNAASAETSERDGFYKNAIDECRRASDTDAAGVFDNTRDTEVEHGNLFAQALRTLDSLKKEKEFYVCDLCGYTTDIRLGLCPVCRASGAHVHQKG